MLSCSDTDIDPLIFCLSLVLPYDALAGFVETTLEHAKHLHIQLNMNSLQLGKGPSWKKKVTLLALKFTVALL